MITDKRITYMPFEYPEAMRYYYLQQDVHWTKREINMAEDIQNWKFNLTENEKEVVGGILKGFTQMEILVGDYWKKVGDWFPKSEIVSMSAAFSYFETIHQTNYNMINESLGFDDYESFLYDEDIKSKLDYFIETKAESIEEIAKSLAIFSAFAEGCMLFSSFAVLLSFQKENLMKGVGQIVSFSIRDENIHSEAGCYLFRELCKEYPTIKDSIKEDIIKAAKLTFELESNFIDSIFIEDRIRTINKHELKEFIKLRINVKMTELGYNSIYEIDNNLVKNMQWFASLSGGREFADFFATRVTEYTNYEINPNNMF